MEEFNSKKFLHRALEMKYVIPDFSSSACTVKYLENMAQVSIDDKILKLKKSSLRKGDSYLMELPELMVHELDQEMKRILKK
jgi:hypothetical protein